MANTGFIERCAPALLVAAAALLGASGAAAQLNVAGTHGLWVQLERDSVIVRWVTPELAAGSIRVNSGTRSVLRRSTRSGHAHRAAFAAAGLDTVEVRFGTNDARSQHRVRISLAPPRRPEAVLAQPDTLFIVGDTHGAFDQLLEGMRSAGLIDRDLRWRGGARHIVFAGDMTDRGPDVLALLWFLYQLEPQAEAAGGRVHVVLGNHEIMVMLGDLRYVHEKEMFVAQQHGATYDALFDPNTSLLGRWLASKPAAMRIGEVAIVHGGVAPEYARLPIPALNDSLALYLRTPPRVDAAPAGESADSAAEQARHDFFWGDRSVFWHRDYVRTDNAGGDLDAALGLWSARTLVVGHTAVARIAPLYGGRVIAAHTPRYGAELLMLVRRDGGTQRFRITTDKPPEAF